MVIGEYGLLGYDKGEKCNQPDEELKYYEYMNELSRKYGICLMFWDNGSSIDRTSGKYQWKKSLAGEMLKASFQGRSSYATGLDTLYFDKAADEDMEIPLTRNSNTFVGIQDLKEEDYSYDERTETVTLRADDSNHLYDSNSGYSLMGELFFLFDSGAPWHEKLVKYAAPVFEAASGTTKGLTIPVSYNGAQFRKISAFSGENHTGPHSDWWKYLENSYAFQVEDDSFTLDARFFGECAEGDIRLVLEFFDGQTVELEMKKDEERVKVSGREAS